MNITVRKQLPLLRFTKKAWWSDITCNKLATNETKPKQFTSVLLWASIADTT